MTGQAQRMILLLALVVAGLLLVMMALVFLWPGDRSEWVDVGRADSFAPGTVTSFRIVEGRANLVTSVPDQQVPHGYGVHIVRLEDGELRAFSWSSTHLGWAVEWTHEIEVPPELVEDGTVGLFRDRFSHWTIDGRPLFGPAPRGLDRYVLEVTDQNRVVIEISRVLQGERPPRTSPAANGTPTPAATPPAPAGAP
jgi:Rieske Fe-S protein